MTQDSTAVRIPLDLAARVDQLWRIPGFGYRSRAEFIVEAIRRRVDEVEAVLDRHGGDLIGSLERKGLREED